MILISALNAIRNKIFMMAHFWTSKKMIVDFGMAHFWTGVVGCTTSFDWASEKLESVTRKDRTHANVFISNFINFYLNWTIVIWKKYSKLKKNNEFPAKSIFDLFSYLNFRLSQSNGPKVCHPRRHGVKLKISSKT